VQYLGALKYPKQLIAYCIGKVSKTGVQGRTLAAWWSNNGQKGGIHNHPSNYQLDETTIRENICKEYKLFHQLKTDLDQHDMWLVGII